MFRCIILLIKSETCPFLGILSAGMERDNLAGAHKETKGTYQAMMTDLLQTGLFPSLTTVEIGSLGHHNPDTIHRLKKFAHSSTTTDRRNT